jgi:hypothetical protein
LTILTKGRKRRNVDHSNCSIITLIRGNAQLRFFRGFNRRMLTLSFSNWKLVWPEDAAVIGLEASFPQTPSSILSSYCCHVYFQIICLPSRNSWRSLDLVAVRIQILDIAALQGPHEYQVQGLHLVGAMRR